MFRIFELRLGLLALDLTTLVLLALSLATLMLQVLATFHFQTFGLTAVRLVIRHLNQMHALFEAKIRDDLLIRTLVATLDQTDNERFLMRRCA